MSAPHALPGLPGSTVDPGHGPAEPAVLDALLDDGVLTLAAAATGPADAIGTALDRHRALAGGDGRDLVAALVVPAHLAAALPAVLTPHDLGTRILLATAEPNPFAALDALGAARSALWDEDRVELLGQRLTFPPGISDPVAAVGALLPLLAVAVPSWIILPPGTPGGVLDALAADGAEHVTLDLADGDPLALAGLVRAFVDRDLTFRAAGAAGVHHASEPGGAPGLLNVLCAVRAALNGAEPEELAQVLASADEPALVSAVRRMSAADGAVTRAFLVAVEVPDATATLAELQRLGLSDDTSS